MRRYFIGFLVVIGLIILLIALIMHGGSNNGTVGTTSVPLPDYADTNAVTTMLIDGPTNADQVHNQVKVSVSSTSTTLQVIQGYNGDAIKTATYPNTEASYSAFLHALQYAGYTDGSTSTKYTNEQGYCPTGDRYIFSLTQNSQSVQRYWTTSCSADPRTFNGDGVLVLHLFQAQVPNYASLTQGVDI